MPDDSLTSLARLANDTGGRYTEASNDLTLAYARAQRDLGCVYSIGFYVKGKLDQIRNVSIRVKRSGLRAVHPGKYAFRSPSKRRQTLLKAAFASPELFQSGVVRAHLYPARPASRKAWEGLLVISFPVPLGERTGEAAAREFGAVLYEGSKVMHRFGRKITLKPADPDSTFEPRITFIEPVTVGPGTYTLSAVMTDPERARPHAAKTQIEVPRVPRRELMLTGPILGRHAGSNVVVESDGQAAVGDRIGRGEAFEPLLVHRLARPVELMTLTDACVVASFKPDRKNRDGTPPTIERSLRRVAGEVVGRFDPVELALEGDGPVRCQNLLDVLPATSVHGGEYVFEAEFASDRVDDPAAGRIRFAVGPATGLP